MKLLSKFLAQENVVNINKGATEELSGVKVDKEDLEYFRIHYQERIESLSQCLEVSGFEELLKEMRDYTKDKEGVFFDFYIKLKNAYDDFDIARISKDLEVMAEFLKIKK